MSDGILYKNFLLDKISNSISTLNTTGDGISLVNERNGPDLAVKSLVEGAGIIISETDDEIVITTAGAGLGDVTGPLSSTDNAISRFDGTSGKMIKDTPNTAIDDLGNMVVNSIDTGNGATGVYIMDQSVTTSDDVAFNSITNETTISNNISATNPVISMNKSTEFENGFTVNSGIVDISNATSIIGLPDNIVYNDNPSTLNGIPIFEDITGKFLSNTNITITENAGNYQIENILARLTKLGFNIYGTNRVAHSITSNLSDADNIFCFCFGGEYDGTNIIANVIKVYVIFYDNGSLTIKRKLDCVPGTAYDILLFDDVISYTDTGILLEQPTIISFDLNPTNYDRILCLDGTNNIKERNILNDPWYDQDLNIDSDVAFGIITSTSTKVLFLDSSNPTFPISVNDNIHFLSEVTFNNIDVIFGNSVITGGNIVLNTVGSTDNALARYDGTTGLLLQDSNTTLDDAGNLTVTTLNTGNGISEIFPMDQAVLTISSVTFAQVDTPIISSISGTITFEDDIKYQTPPTSSTNNDYITHNSTTDTLEVRSIIPMRGAIKFQNNGLTTSLTLNTWFIFNTTWSSLPLVSVNTTLSSSIQITSTQDGVAFLNAVVSYKTVNNQDIDIEFVFFKNSIILADSKQSGGSRDNKNGDNKQIVLSFMDPYTLNDVYDIRVRNTTNNNNLILIDCNFNIYKI